MKKYIYLLLIGFILFPINAFAKSYTLKDLSISIDDSNWIVLTRDNIDNNDLLNQVGITYEYMKNFMESNDVYLDAVKYNDDIQNNIELFVAIKEAPNLANLYSYDSDEIGELGEAFKEKVKANAYDI